MIKDHLGNLYKSKQERARKYNLSVKTIDRRLQLNWSLEDALCTPVKTIEVTIDHLGNSFKSKKEKCDYWGVKVSTYNDRISKNYSEQDALTLPKQNVASIEKRTLNGVVYSSENKMCIENGIAPKLYRERLSRGLNKEEAICNTNLSVLPAEERTDENGIVYKSVSEMAIANGISPTVFYTRRSRGNKELFKEVVTYKDHLGNQYKNLEDLCLNFGITPQIYRNRYYKHQWSLKDTLTIPVKASFGEHVIEKYLIEHNYTFFKNKSLSFISRTVDFDVEPDDLAKMRPDFFVMVGTMKFAIEYDGMQHFREIQSWHHNSEEFKRRHTIDIKKNTFFKNNNIPFLRISYCQDNKIEEALDQFFKDPDYFIDRHNPFLNEDEYWEEYDNNVL